jgi:hypothetical protein
VSRQLDSPHSAPRRRRGGSRMWYCWGTPSSAPGVISLQCCPPVALLVGVSHGGGSPPPTHTNSHPPGSWQARSCPGLCALPNRAKGVHAVRVCVRMLRASDHPHRVCRFGWTTDSTRERERGVPGCVLCTSNWCGDVGGGGVCSQLAVLLLLSAHGKRHHRATNSGPPHCCVRPWRWRLRARYRTSY